MANNYSQFSAEIPGLTPEACEWVEEVLVDLDEQDDPDAACKRLKKLLPLEDKYIDLNCWPNFCWKLEDGCLWLYSEENFDLDHLVLFVQALIHKFMPDHIFAMTWADTCSKPRIGEFGGGWLVIAKAAVVSGHTWNEEQKRVEALRTGNFGPEIDN